MAAGSRQEPGGGRAAVQPGREMDAGPASRRATLFMRLTYVVAGLSWIAALAALPYLPETIPIHWNALGQADQYASGLVGAFSFAVIITLTAIFLTVSPRFKRWRHTFDYGGEISAIVILATVSMIFGLQGLVLLSSAGVDLPLTVGISMLIGFFFIVAGSLMPSIPRNLSVGFRLPWTIRDETVWKKTHEHGGPVLLLAGIVIVPGSAIAGAWAIPLAVGISVAAILYVTVWSYRLWRNREKAER
ncbi:MAG TPA: SdpI family protein [Methanomicrobiales archaeon]|nr:SdpI family protein [Methanomicrobiales archaeon]